jgi:flagellar assembly factor FliW
MRITTQRFGVIDCAEKDVIYFSGGLSGCEPDHPWLLLSDESHGGLFWLQSVRRPDRSLPVVDPREFVPRYRLHVPRRQLLPVGLRGGEAMVVLALVIDTPGGLGLNLHDPLVINPQNRLGRQVTTCDDRPLEYRLPVQLASLRKAA